MKESNLVTEFKQACKNYGYFFYKIPDAYNMERFSPKKPFDAIMGIDGKGIAIEFKMIKSKSAFAFDRVRPHQIEGLIDAQKSGGFISLIIINYRFKTKENKRYNKLFVISLNKFLKIQLKSDRKSIPFSEMETMEEIHRGSPWDLEVFFYSLFSRIYS